MESSTTKLRPSDRESLAERRSELRRRIEGFEQEQARNAERVRELQADEAASQAAVELTTRQAEAAQAALDRATGELRRVQLNGQVVAESQEKLLPRLDEAREELREVEQLIGRERPVPAPARETAQVEEAEQIAARFGMFGNKDMAAALKAKQGVADALIATLVGQGRLTDTGRKMLGQRMFEYVPTSEETAETDNEAKHLVRDWICSQKPGRAFTRAQIKEQTETSDTEVEQALEWAIERGIVRNVGVEGADIFEYDPPKEPGKSAVADMKRRRERDVGGGGGGRADGRAVAGTGRGLTITDPDVRALVQACERLGATVTHAADGHLKVSYNGKSTNIAATPSSRRTVLNDRTRVRRNLGLQLAG